MSPKKAQVVVVPEEVVLLEMEPATQSTVELLFGPLASPRRLLSTFVLAFSIATFVRNLCFSEYIFGTKLLHSLSPVEREAPQWSYILFVRALDIVLAQFAWAYSTEGKVDAVVLGGIIAAISRSSLYAFEHSYFLLTSATVSTLLISDVVSFGAAAAILPILMPHSVTSHRVMSSLQKISRDRELLINVVLAVTLATFLGALSTFILERIGGTTFVKSSVYELTVPSILASDTLTSSEILKNPTLPIPVLRSFLESLPMETHLLHSFVQAILSVFLSMILPTFSPLLLPDLVASLVGPATTLLLWDVLPISFVGALSVGLALGSRAALITGTVAWILEELRSVRRVERNTVVVVQDEEVEIIEAEGAVDVVVERGNKEVVVESGKGGARRRI